MNDTREMNRAEHNHRTLRRDYELPQPASPVALREYMLTTKQRQRCCLLRWVLRDPLVMDAMSFTLTQLDEYGEVIESTPVTYTADELPPLEVGQLFAPDWAIPVAAHCVAVRVQVHKIVSGDYLYEVTPTDVTVHYCADVAWTYDEQAIADEDFPTGETILVRSKLGRRVPGVWPVALLSLLVVAFAICAPYLARIIPIETVKRVIEEALSTVGQFFEWLWTTVRQFFVGLFDLLGD